MLAFHYWVVVHWDRAAAVFKERLSRGASMVAGDRRHFAVLRPNIQVIGHALGNLLEHRRGNLSAVVALSCFGSSIITEMQTSGLSAGKNPMNEAKYLSGR